MSRFTSLNDLKKNEEAKGFYPSLIISHVSYFSCFIFHIFHSNNNILKILENREFYTGGVDARGGGSGLNVIDPNDPR